MCFKDSDITVETLQFLFRYSFEDKTRFPNVPSKDAKIFYGIKCEFWNHCGFNHLFLTDSGGRIVIERPDGPPRAVWSTFF